jgi:hypothetical protein
MLSCAFLSFLCIVGAAHVSMPSWGDGKTSGGILLSDFTFQHYVNSFLLVGVLLGLGFLAGLGFLRLKLHLVDLTQNFLL